MTTIIQAPEVGEQLSEQEHRPLTRSDIVRYAGASGDFNPLHHDEPLATRLGFPSVFSIGMYQAGLLANFAAEAFGPEHVRRVALRFASQVWPGDVLTCSGTVNAVEPIDEGHRVEVDLTCRRRGADGTEGVAITGTATFVLP